MATSASKPSNPLKRGSIVSLAIGLPNNDKLLKECEWSGTCGNYSDASIP
jgi:hypothetical protein